MRQHTHLGAYAILRNEDNIILIKKSRGAYTGTLDLPGGRLEHGEDPKDTVKREVMEEVGIDISSIKLINVLSHSQVWEDIDQALDLHHIGIIYEAKINSNVALKKEAFEDSLGAEWYNINTLKKEDLSPFAYEIVKYLKSGK